jgi:hypothetical protein
MNRLGIRLQGGRVHFSHIVSVFELDLFIQARYSMHGISNCRFSVCELDYNATPERVIVKSAYPRCCTLIEQTDGTAVRKIARKETDLSLCKDWKDLNLRFLWFLLRLQVAVACATS